MNRHEFLTRAERTHIARECELDPQSGAGAGMGRPTMGRTKWVIVVEMNVLMGRTDSPYR